MKKILLKPNNYYHIYNRGINATDIFFVEYNYRHFLNLYERYIQPISDTFAWVLMKNHFHFLLKINTKDEIISTFPNLQGFENLEGLDTAVIKRIYQQFSNLFNAYTKAFNKKYSRTGALFESNFHRKEVKTVNYFKQLIIYINNNPVHHGFCDKPGDYPWSSYNSTILKPFRFLGILTNLFFFNIEAKSIGIARAIAIYFNEDSEKKKEPKTLKAM